MFLSWRNRLLKHHIGVFEGLLYSFLLLFCLFGGIRPWEAILLVLVDWVETTPIGIDICSLQGAEQVQSYKVYRIEKDMSE